MIGDVYKYRIVQPNTKALTDSREPKNHLYEGEGFLTHITKEDKFILEDRATGMLLKANFFFELQRLYQLSDEGALAEEKYKGPTISAH